MNIVKYKKSTKGRYNVTLDNGDTLLLYEDVILKYNLLLTKKIEDNMLLEINKYNQECDVYRVALDSLKSRFKSVKDMRLFLKKKEYPDNLIDTTIDKLINQGYLNDRSFCKSFINNQMLTSSRGPGVISRLLIDKGIDLIIINEEMKVFSEEEQMIRIDKLINKGIRANHNKGGVVLKQKIYNDIKNLGYDFTLINKVIDNYSFDNNKDIAKREYDKLYRKYSKKYEGYELKRIIKEKMYQKGLSYEE